MKVLLLANSQHLYRFRLPLASALCASRHEVVLATTADQYATKLAEAGFRCYMLPLERSGINPLRELKTIFSVARLYGRERPDLVHHFTLKCAIYGSLAARYRRVENVINGVTGLGYIFHSRRFEARLLRPFVSLLCKAGLRGSRVVFENPDNRDLFVTRGIVSEGASYVIRGAGVDVHRFSPSPEPKGIPIVLLAGRMIWEKGIADFVEAARLLKRNGVVARFVLLGPSDSEDRGTIPQRTLEEWDQAGDIEWWGESEDMPVVLSRVHVVCLPSSGEGAPTVLMEASASGRAIVATDVSGCREVVRHGENGLRVPPRDPRALAAAIATLLNDPALRAQMGARGRELSVREFSEERVVRETLELYRELLGKKWSAAA